MGSKASYWKHSNLTLFAYKAEKPREKQALSDWNRHIMIPEKCGYYINGVKLSDLRHEPFKDREEMKDFFKAVLFSKYKGERLDELVESALFHFHQAGLQHTTNFCTNNITRNQLKCSDPVTRIDFISTEDGVSIKEDNKYQEIVNTKTGKKTDFITDADKYHARTTTEYNFTDEGYTVQNLEVDCPNRQVADVFDKRTLLEKITQYINNVIAEWGSGPEKDKEAGSSLSL